jgi:hypothetical protein
MDGIVGGREPDLPGARRAILGQFDARRDGAGKSSAQILQPAQRKAHDLFELLRGRFHLLGRCLEVRCECRLLARDRPLLLLLFGRGITRQGHGDNRFGDSHDSEQQ